MAKRKQSVMGRVLHIFLKIFAGLLLSLAVIVTSALAYLGSDHGRAKIRDTILQQTRDLIPGLKLGAIKGNLSDHFIVERLSLADRFGDSVFSLDRLKIRYDLSMGRLLRREIAIYTLELERPRLTIRKAKNGKLNLTQIVTPSSTEVEKKKGAEEASDWQVQLGVLRIDDGGVTVEIEASLAKKPPTTKTVTVDNIALNLDGFAREGQAHLTLHQLSLACKIPGRSSIDVYLHGGLTSIAGHLHGLLKLKGRGISSRDNVDLSLEAGGRLNAPTLKVRIEEGTIERVGLDVSVELPLDKGRYDVALRVRGLEPHRFLPELPSASLALDMSLKGKGLPTKEASETDFHLSVLPSSMDGHRIKGGNIDAALNGKIWKLSKLSLNSPYGTIRAKGKGDLSRVDVALEADLPGLAKIPAQLTGAPLAGMLKLKAKVKGNVKKSLAVSGRLEGNKLGYADFSVARIDLPFQLDGLPNAPRGSVDLSLNDFRATSQGLHVETAKAWVVGNRRAFEIKVEGRGHELDLAVQATLRVKRTIEIQLAKLRGMFRGIDLRLVEPASVSFAQRKKRVTFEPLRFRLMGGELKVGGDLQLAPSPRGNATVSISDLNLAAARRLLKLPRSLRGRVDLTGKFQGSMQAPNLDLRLGLRHFAVDKLASVNTRLHFQGGKESTRVAMNLRWKQKDLLQLNASTPRSLGKVLRTLKNRSHLEQMPVAAAFELHATSLESVRKSLPKLPALKGVAAAKIELAGSLRKPRLNVTGKWDGAQFEARQLGNVALSLDAKGDRDIVSSLTIRHNQSPLLAVKSVLRASAGKLLASPSALMKTVLEAEAQLGPYPLKGLAGLDANLKQLKGALSGTINISGSPKSPQAKWAVGIEKLSRAKLKVEDLRLSGSYARNRIEALLSLKQGKTGEIDGRLDYLLKEKTIKAKVRGRALDLGLASLAPMVEKSGGVLDLDVSLEGPQSKPDIRAQVEIKKAHLHLFGQSPLSDIGLRLSLTPEELAITGLKLHSGDGDLKGEARVELTDRRPGKFTAEFEATRLGGFPGALAQASFDGKIVLAGAVSESQLRGKIKLTEGILRIPKLEGQDDLHSTAAMTDLIFVDAEAAQKEAQQKIAKQAEGATDKARGKKVAAKDTKPLGLDLSFETPAFFIRGEQLRTEVSAKIKATTDKKGDLVLKGRVHSERGEVNILGSAFKLQRANILFSGEPANPGLAVELTRNIGGITVLLGVRGTAAAPELILNSDPSGYDRSQLLSLILTGRLELDQGSSDAEGQAVAVANAVGQALVGDYARQLAGKVGLDVAKLNVGQHQDGAGAKKLHLEAEVGKYITRRLYMGYRQVVGADEGQNSYIGLMEYSISARWLLTALLGDAGVGALDLLWTYQY